jgi:pimeloyl-ACP methyl ester carboxylesterase
LVCKWPCCDTKSMRILILTRLFLLWPATAAHYHRSVVDVMGCTVAYLELMSPIERHWKATVLLLHGERYSSQTWSDLGTFEFLGDSEIRTIAVDLPGYGTSGARIDHESDADFMQALIRNLKLSRYEELNLFTFLRLS